MKKFYFLWVLWAVLSPCLKAQVSAYDLNAPFGWVCCSSLTSADDYTLTGGAGGTQITLTSTGADMKAEILAAIKAYDVVVFDGQQGDFLVSSIINLSKLKNKTLVGINGARLCTQWHVTSELKQMLDDHGVPGMSTMGGGGTLQNGVTVAEEAEYMTRYLIIEQTGDLKEAYRNSGIFYIESCENIIVRNLKFVGPGSIDVGGSDLLSCIKSTRHLWVDHCDFTDGMDGNFDITNQSDFVTVSWCTFSYTDYSYMHQNTNLVGSSDSKTADEDKLNITFANNIWGAKCRARMPMARFGTIHMLNNYFNCPGNASDCINPRKNAEFLIEGNYFAKGVKKIFSQSGAKAYVWAADNYTTEAFTPKSKGTVVMPYAYSVIDATRLPALLTSEQGAGATLTDPLSIGAGGSNLNRVEAGSSDGPIYDICGRRVDAIARPGIYIRGGKKFVIY